MWPFLNISKDRRKIIPEMECVKALEVYYWERHTLESSLNEKNKSNSKYPTKSGEIKIIPKCPLCHDKNKHRFKYIDPLIPSEKKKKLKYTLYQCNFSPKRKKFTVLTGTPFKNVKSELINWFKIDWYYRKYNQTKPHLKQFICERTGIDRKMVKKVITAIEKMDDPYLLLKIRNKYYRYKKRIVKVQDGLENVEIKPTKNLKTTKQSKNKKQAPKGFDYRKKMEEVFKDDTLEFERQNNFTNNDDDIIDDFPDNDEDNDLDNYKEDNNSEDEELNYD